MHTHNNYRFVRLVIGDPDGTFRGALQDSLFHCGFRDIIQVRNTTILGDVLNQESIDLVMIDLQLPSDDITVLVQKIRRGIIGQNPYCLIVALATNPTAEKLKQISRSGVDDILVRPHTMGALIAHINRLVHDRKPFVMTDTYFGPNLRTVLRADGSDETNLLGVPNTLRAKFIDGVNSAQAMTMITDTHSKVKDARGKVQQRRGDKELSAVSDAIQTVLTLDGGNDHGVYVEAIARLEQITSQIHQHHVDLPKTTRNDLALNLIQLIRTGIDMEDSGYHADVPILQVAALHLAHARQAIKTSNSKISAKTG